VRADQADHRGDRPAGPERGGSEKGVCRECGAAVEEEVELKAADMPHYVAIVEDAGPEKAVGIWFPGLPGWFSAGGGVGEAVRTGGEAIEFYAEELAKDGRDLPPPRTVSELRSDTRVADDLKDHLIALVQAPQAAHAAE